MLESQARRMTSTVACIADYCRLADHLPRGHDGGKKLGYSYSSLFLVQSLRQIVLDSHLTDGVELAFQPAPG